jgi:hypothetical protein
MIIDIVLVSSNENPTYYNFYPYVKPIWEKLTNSKCILLYVGNSIPDNLIQFKDDIVLFDNSIPQLNHIHTAFLAQNVRLLYPALFDNKNVLITDIDSIPLNSHYYLDQIKDYDNSKFINYSFDPDVFSKNEHNIPYSLANSSVWKDIFNINNLNDIINTLQNWYSECGTYLYNEKFRSKCVGFHFDQQIFFKYLENWKTKTNNLILFNLSNRNRFNPNSINKSHFNLELQKIKNGSYDDYFYLRPFKKYLDLNLEIKNIILNS